MPPIKIQNTIVSLCQEPEETLSQEMLALSSTLQNFCNEALKSSMIAGSTVSHLLTSVAGFKTFALCSRLFGDKYLWVSKTITCSTQILTSGITFHVAPEFFAKGAIQQENLFSGSATSTMMVAFSRGATKLGGGAVLQKIFQNFSVLCSQEASAYFGFCEAQTGGALSRVVYAELGSCQLSIGATTARLSCRQMVLMEAQLDFNQSFQKRAASKTGSNNGWFQSIQSFFKTPQTQALTTERIQLPIPESNSQRPWQQKEFHSLRMAKLTEASKDRIHERVNQLAEARSLGEKVNLRKLDPDLLHALKRRESLVSKILQSEVGKEINDKTMKEWETVRQTLSERPNGTTLIELINKLEQLTSRVLSQASNPKETPLQSEAGKILTSRLTQLLNASVREAIGEPLAPSEKLLIENLEAAFSEKDSENVSQDQLVKKLLQANSSMTHSDFETLIREEKIREATRKSIYLLPGHGRGMIDSLDQVAQNQAIQMQQSATAVFQGPTSRFASLRMMGRFLLTSTFILSTLGAVDFFTQKCFHLYDRCSSLFGRYVMKPSKWLPIFSPEAIRTIEEVRIKSVREKRPIMIIPKHASLLDIIALTAIFSEARFVAKEELKWIPPVAATIFGGGHFLIDRENVMKAIKQMRQAGKRMIRDGVAMIIFPEGTRSAMLRDEIKKGFAHTMADINAIGLIVTPSGLEMIQPVERELLEGIGVNQLIPFRVRELDPQQLPLPSKKNKVSVIHKLGSQMMEEDFIANIKDYQRLAEQGNQMAAIQLAAIMAPPRKAFEQMKEYQKLVEQERQITDLELAKKVDSPEKAFKLIEEYRRRAKEKKAKTDSQWADAITTPKYAWRSIRKYQQSAEEQNPIAIARLSELIAPLREILQAKSESKRNEAELIAKKYKTSVERLLWIHSSVDGENFPS